MMARTRGELAITHAAQHPAQRLFADGNAKFRIDPLRQIGQPPAHHPVHRRVRAGFDDVLQRRALLDIQQRHLTRRLAVDQPLRAGRVECQHPVPHRLDPDAADPRRFAARPSFIDRRQRQQTPGLVRVSRRLRQRAQLSCVVILPKSHRQRHDTLPPYAMVKHTRGGLESLHRSRSSGFGIILMQPADRCRQASVGVPEFGYLLCSPSCVFNDGETAALARLTRRSPNLDLIKQVKTGQRPSHRDRGCTAGDCDAASSARSSTPRPRSSVTLARARLPRSICAQPARFVPLPFDLL
jgi:hypothetical protein